VTAVRDASNLTGHAVRRSIREPGASHFQAANGVTWSNGPITVLGEIVDGAIVLSPDS